MVIWWIGANSDIYNLNQIPDSCLRPESESDVSGATELALLGALSLNSRTALTIMINYTHTGDWDRLHLRYTRNYIGTACTSTLHFVLFMFFLYCV